MSNRSPISERDLQQAVRRLFHNHQYILVNSLHFIRGKYSLLVCRHFCITHRKQATLTMQQEKKYPDLQTKIIEEEITRRWNSLTRNPEGIMTRESLREGVVRDMLINGQLSKEADIIFKIVEQWGNAACPMTVMEQWLKDYAAAQRPAGSAVWVKATTWPQNHNEVHWRIAKSKTPIIVIGRNYQDNIIIQFGKVYSPDELEWLDEQPVEQISDDAHEKEVMMQAFDKVRQLFEGREWIMEGRGMYPYNDDRYKEEVRYMYDEFDKLFKDTWGSIKSKSCDYRQAIIAEYVKGEQKENVGKI